MIWVTERGVVHMRSEGWEVGPKQNLEHWWSFTLQDDHQMRCRLLPMNVSQNSTMKRKIHVAPNTTHAVSSNADLKVDCFGLNPQGCLWCRQPIILSLTKVDYLVILTLFFSIYSFPISWNLLSFYSQSTEYFFWSWRC